MTNKGYWSHCPGIENPADLGSRGIPASKLQEDPLWWVGPKWLGSSDKAWSVSPNIVATEGSKEEEKKPTVLVANVKEVLGIDKVVSIEKFSSLERLF